MKSRVVVISASFGAGHDGAAAELARRLGGMGYRVDRHDLVDLVPRRYGRLLRTVYHRQLLNAPRTWDWTLTLTGRERIAGAIARSTAVADGPVAAAVGTDAAAVVSTYPLASQILGRLRRDGSLLAPAVTYFTDLSVHPLWVADGIDVHLALHHDAAIEAKHHGAGDVRVVSPAVAPSFTSTPAAPPAEAAARWGLPTGVGLALIVAGAWGVGAVEAAASEIRGTGVVTPVVACGRNERLRQRLIDQGHLALGWVDDMAGLLRCCRVVVQNAGGLTSLEALAAGVPVVTYRSLPGHGRRNAEALDRAGWVTWIRSRAELSAGLRAALSTPPAYRVPATSPETVLAEVIAAARLRSSDRNRPAENPLGTVA